MDGSERSFKEKARDRLHSLEGEPESSRPLAADAWSQEHDNCSPLLFLLVRRRDCSSPSDPRSPVTVCVFASVTVG